MAYQPDIKVIYKNLKGSAKRRNIPFNLELQDLYDLSFPITCPVLGIPLKFNRVFRADDSYSIDRKDSSLGYTIDNIIVISWRANRLKNNASLNELILIAEFYKGLE